MNIIPTDILREIAKYFNCYTYKAAIATCDLWYKVVKNATFEHSHMNILSTLILRHPEIKWQWNKIGDLITQEIIDKYKNEINLQYANISLNPRLSRNFILNNWSKFDDDIYRNRALTLDIIRELIRDYGVSVARFAGNHNLDEVFIREHWLGESLAYNPNTPIDLLETLEDGYYYTRISSNVNMSEQFIRDYWTDFDLGEISENRAFTLKLIRENWDDLGSENGELYLHRNPNITIEFLHEYKDIIDWDDMVQHPLVSLEMIRDLINKGKISIGAASWSINIDDTFIREFADKLYWTAVIRKNTCSIELAEKNLYQLKEIWY